MLPGTYLACTGLQMSTDDSLRWLLSLSVAFETLLERRSRRYDLDCDVASHVGVKHQAADVLSRSDTHWEKLTDLSDRRTCMTCS